MKKRYLFLTVGVIGSMLLSGCGGNNAADKDMAPMEFPLEEQVTLDYWAPMDSKAAQTVQSYGELTAYQELERLTNVKINFIHPAVGNENEAFGLLVASASYPDMIYNNWKTVTGGATKYVEDGVIYPFTEQLETLTPNYNRLLQETEGLKKEVQTDDGRVYIFSATKIDPKLKMTGGLIIRRDWLDKLNLSVPETPEEWYTVLKAFKEQDPNGNGVADEIPFTARKFNGLTKFNSAFGVNDTFYQKDDKVLYGPIQPEFKEYLTFLHNLYAEGLIDSDYLINDNKQFDTKVLTNTAGAFQGSVIGNVGRYMTSMQAEHPEVDMVGVQSPKSSDGMRYLMTNELIINHTGGGAVVTSNCKNKGVALQWLDFQYGEAGHMLMNFGKEGETYEMVDGYPRYTDEILNNPSGLSVTEAMCKHFTANFNSPMDQDIRYLEQSLTLPQQEESIENWQKGLDSSRAMPEVSLSVEENDEFASIMNDITIYKEEMVDKFIMGTEALDKFDEFVSNIQNRNIQKAVEIRQKALERYRNR